MLNRTTRLRLRRGYKRSRQHVEGIGDQAEQQLDRHFFRRLAKLAGIKRFVISWVLLLVLLTGITVSETRSLASYYLEPTPASGGTHTEGMVGAFTNANPLYAMSTVDVAVSRLLFAGLLQLDSRGRLEPNLAQSWKVNEAGDEYSIALKPGLKWHDGQPLTVEDVAYTFQMAGHPDAKSPFFQTWREVTTKITGARTLTFTLKNPLAAFPYSLTTGIVPKHILKHFTPGELRSASFNTRQPVGAGPFRWQTIETVGSDRETIQQHVGLQRFDDYHMGEVGLDRFLIYTFTNNEQMVDAFKKQQISAMAGLDQLPDELVGDDAIVTYETPMLAANMAFFRTDSEVLTQSNVRRALVQAVDVPALLKKLGYPVIVSDEPVLKEHRTYDSDYRQHGFNPKASKELLEKAGWRYKAGSDIRTNGKKKLVIKLYGQNTPDFSRISQEFQKAWKEIGVSAEVLLQSPDELQGTIANRTYDVLLTGITIGADPDVFVYWHSSQADPRSPTRLNFSHYKSDAADAALESARSKVDNKLRSVKFEPFLSAWKNDVPAMSLYQPRFFYISRGQVFNYGGRRITNPADRFWNVHQWKIRQEASIIGTEN